MEWLLLGQPVDQVVPAKGDSAARIVAPDPRMFALQKLWLSEKPSRSSLKMRKFFESGSAAGVQPHHAKRIRMLLAALDTAKSIGDMDIPGFRLHPLKGEERGRWSVWVNGNWRMTFEFKDGHAYVLDYEDYH